MKTLALTKKIADKAGILVEEGAEIDFYVHTVEIGGDTLVIIVRPDTFFSYTTTVDSGSSEVFGEAIRRKIGTKDIRYVLAKDKREISKLTTVGKKYKQLILRAFELDDGPLELEGVEELANSTPWKFLEFRSPMELEKSCV